MVTHFGSTCNHAGNMRPPAITERPSLLSLAISQKRAEVTAAKGGYSRRPSNLLHESLADTNEVRTGGI